MPVVDEGVDRHQLDRRDAEPTQVVDRGLAREARVRAAQVLRDVWMERRESLHVQLVDHAFRPTASAAADRRPS